MAASIRSVAMGLPRVSMARIPLVAFANTHVAPLSHANSVHPSAFSSMPASRKDKTWSNSANKVADQLEHTASKFPEDNDRTTKDYLREVKQFEHAEDALLRDLGLIKSVHQEDDIYNHSKHPSKNTPSKNTPSKSTASKSNSSTGKKRAAKSAEEPKDTFEETFVAQVRADVFYPSTKMNHDDSQHHQQEMVSSLLEELKNDNQTANLSQHASDAIRMVESHNVLKQDEAPIHDVREEDPTQKTMRTHKRK
ncbi:hypothetical protein BGZ54_005836 [Gamsiella multidivaricata]|nr:hypothetical protein BGZ54_005836 [Gamsiella multidivaricata]